MEQTTQTGAAPTTTDGTQTAGQERYVSGPATYGMTIVAAALAFGLIGVGLSVGDADAQPTSVVQQVED